MIFVRIRHLPPDSATQIALGGAGWTTTDRLLADVFHATAGVPHPALPKIEQPLDVEREQRMAEARKRSRDRQLAIEAGYLT